MLLYGSNDIRKYITTDYKCTRSGILALKSRYSEHFLFNGYECVKGLRELQNLIK